MVELELSATTDRGRVRDSNEDVARVLPRLALALVADGMGGHDHGEVASGLIVEAMEESYARIGGAGASAEAMRANVMESIREANSRVRMRRLADTSEMGTTLVAAAFGHAHVAVAHVGDSRVYRLRRAQLEQLTNDHSLAARLRSEGHSEREAQRFEHVLTRSLNGDGRTVIDVRVEPVEPDDVYLLCSDGLWGAVSDDYIARILQLASTAEDACSRLIRAALIGGGDDNIGVAVVRCAPVASARDGKLARAADQSA